MSEWISVEDSLPDFVSRAGGDEFVFVIASGDIGVGEYMFSSQNGWSKVGFFDDLNISVTHWMPMPAPPGGE